MRRTHRWSHRLPTQCVPVLHTALADSPLVLSLSLFFVFFSLSISLFFHSIILFSITLFSLTITMFYHFCFFLPPFSLSLSLVSFSLLSLSLSLCFFLPPLSLSLSLCFFLPPLSLLRYFRYQHPITLHICSTGPTPSWRLSPPTAPSPMTLICVSRRYIDGSFVFTSTCTAFTQTLPNSLTVWTFCDCACVTTSAL